MNTYSYAPNLRGAQRDIGMDHKAGKDIVKKARDLLLDNANEEMRIGSRVFFNRPPIPILHYKEAKHPAEPLSDVFKPMRTFSQTLDTLSAAVKTRAKDFDPRIQSASPSNSGSAARVSAASDRYHFRPFIN